AAAAASRPFAARGPGREPPIRGATRESRWVLSLGHEYSAACCAVRLEQEQTERTEIGTFSPAASVKFLLLFQMRQSNHWTQGAGRKCCHVHWPLQRWGVAPNRPLVKFQDILIFHTFALGTSKTKLCNYLFISKT